MDVTWHGYNAAGAPEALALRRGTAADVRGALLAARQRTLALAEDYRAALGPAQVVPYAPERNPPLWELGHVAWFQEWWIARNPRRGLGVRCDPAQPRLPSQLPRADACYDSSKVAHRTRWDLPLPDAEGTRDYLQRTLQGTLALLEELPAGAGDDALYFFRLAALHEQMHAEAAVYMAQGLGIPLRGAPPRPLGPPRELALPAQRFRLGSAPGGFAFDNELAAHEVDMPALSIDAEPVRWDRFLPFLEAGGRVPSNLRRGRGGWEQQRATAWQPLVGEEAAVHLTADDAEGWCRWAGRRLPTEAEWECAALTLPGFAWGAVWEWTASTFEPYPGFTPHPYQDYSAPWFGTRRVLRGASAATSGALGHARYRNFFEPQRRDILAGFRSARAALAGDG